MLDGDVNGDLYAVDSDFIYCMVKFRILLSAGVAFVTKLSLYTDKTRVSVPSRDRL